MLQAILPFLISGQVPRNATLPLSGAADVEHITGTIVARSGLVSLRKSLLPPGDMELRFWGFGRSIEGFVLRRRSGHWSTARVAGGWPGFESSYHGSKVPVRYSAPRSGWPTFWRKAEKLGVWSMRDESELPPPRHDLDMLDAYSIDVETQRNGVYRAYHYTDPAFEKQWPEALHILAFERLLKAEFPTPVRR